MQYIERFYLDMNPISLLMVQSVLRTAENEFPFPLQILANRKDSRQKNIEREIIKFFLIQPITRSHFFQHLFD